MGHRKFTLPLPWARYSKQLARLIQEPRHVGFFTSDDAAQKAMRLVTARLGSFDEGHYLQLYLLVDESDGVIADAKFQMFGPSVLIGALEAACSLLVRKTLSQAGRLTADSVDKHVQDKPHLPAFPEETFVYLNWVIDVIQEALETCSDLHTEDRPTPVSADVGPSQTYPGWELLSKQEQIAVIEQVIASDIRPYIELDAGGVQIIDLVSGKELLIAYQGACTSCYSATGATLNAIQGILQVKVSPDLVVIPDASFLNQ